MIYTLTTNPAVDMNIAADELKPNLVTRTRDAVYSANGKGLNVSFTLKHFGIDSCILGFFAGFTGEFIIQGACAQACEVDPVYVEGISRVNVFLSTNSCEYTMPNAGCFVSKEKQQELLDKLAQADDLDVLVISGSNPPGIDDDYYQQLADVIEKSGGELVLDLSSRALADLVPRKPLLIAPNQHELAEIFGYSIESLADLSEAAFDLCSKGVKNLLLTLGEEGALFCDGEHLWKASAPKITGYSTACAGDAALAGFLSIWLPAVRELASAGVQTSHSPASISSNTQVNLSANEGSQLERARLAKGAVVEAALKRSMACGASAAMSAGLGDFKAVDKLSAQVEVLRLH